MPVCRTKSAVGNPSSACFKTATICSTENRFLFMANLPFHLREIRQKTNINHGPLSMGRLKIVPIEKVAAEHLCVLDAAEAPWAPQLISQAPATEVAHSTSVSCRQRRIIETLFADLKTKSFNLKDTRIGDPR